MRQGQKWKKKANRRKRKIEGRNWWQQRAPLQWQRFGQKQMGAVPLLQVDKSGDGLNLKIQRSYVKNPEESDTYWPENRGVAFTAYLIAACDGDTCISGRLGVRPANEAQWRKTA